MERDPSKDESDLPGFPEKGFNEPDKTPTQSGRVGVLVNKRDLLLGRLNRILDEINRSYSSWTRELASLNARSGRLRFACPPTVEIPQSEEVTIVTLVDVFRRLKFWVMGSLATANRGFAGARTGSPYHLSVVSRNRVCKLHV